MARLLPRLPLAAWSMAAALGCGCSGPQSALAPAGEEAATLARLFWWMFWGSLVVWAAVVALAWWAARIRPEKLGAARSRQLIIGGGVLLPTIVLTGLLAHGLSGLPPLLAPAPEGALRIAVSGEQWWWRVEYRPAGGQPVVSANEIRLPVGQPVQFELVSPDVIHSFWIPSLGGKIDMIPGRKTRLKLVPTQTGTFRGVCAEYCGASHALMAFPVVVMEPGEFAQWLEARQHEAAPLPVNGAPDEVLARGEALFLANGCGACHAIRGTAADGQVGPDLTHVGSRLTLGAGTLGNDPPDFVRWLAETDRVKPGVLMPHFGMLPPDDLEAMAAYLDALQ